LNAEKKVVDENDRTGLNQARLLYAQVGPVIT